MAHKLEYRVLWGLKGSPVTYQKLFQTKSSALRMVIGTATASRWLGWNPSRLRKAWWILSKRSPIPVDTIESMSLLEVVETLCRISKQIDWLRVEMRAVGTWTEVMDPLNTLKSVSTDATYAKKAELFERLNSLTQGESEAWRKRPEGQV